MRLFFCAEFFRDRVVRFLIVGILSTVLDVGLLYLLTTGFGIWYLASATVSYCCGMGLNFVLNKYVTFQDPCRNYCFQFLVFAAISGIGLLLTLGILYLAVSVGSLNYLIGKVMALGVSFAWNYMGQSRITFRPGKQRQSGAFGIMF